MQRRSKYSWWSNRLVTLPLRPSLHSPHWWLTVTQTEATGSVLLEENKNSLTPADEHVKLGMWQVPLAPPGGQHHNLRRQNSQEWHQCCILKKFYFQFGQRLFTLSKDDFLFCRLSFLCSYNSWWKQLWPINLVWTDAIEPLEVWVQKKFSKWKKHFCRTHF